MDDYQSLREKLELQDWPAVYMYKFIFKGENKKIALIEREFDDAAEIDIKSSTTGKYVSITVKENITNPEDIIDRYKAVAKIEGVIML